MPERMGWFKEISDKFNINFRPIIIYCTTLRQCSLILIARVDILYMIKRKIPDLDFEKYIRYFLKNSFMPGHVHGGLYNILN